MWSYLRLDTADLTCQNAVADVEFLLSYPADAEESQSC